MFAPSCACKILMNELLIPLSINVLAGSYKNGQLVEHTDCKPWVEDSYWEIKRSNNAIIDEAYKQFNGKKSAACDLTRCYSTMLCLRSGILSNPRAISVSSDVLHECRLLNNRATHVISQTERSMSLKKQPKQFAI